MAYNKSKLIDSAQRYLNQGKISQAIAEYQQILRHEPRDQVTLMTIGDLYVRQGETFQALEYFERLAQLFLGDGFVAKAIAIYKKIAKLAPEETKPLERLADLYVQQGVMGEARLLFLQLAETHLRANRHKEAVALLHKLLEAEPDNLRVQTRLAELYNAIGQQKEAAQTYIAAAERQLEHNLPAEAEKLAERALKIAPNHTGALALKAKALAASGKHADALGLLEQLPGLESDSKTAGLLVDTYLQGGQPERAAELARKVFEQTKHHQPTFKVAAALVDSGEADRALELLEPIRKAMIEAGDQELLSQALTSAVERLPGRLEPREWLVELYESTNDAFRLPQALADLAEAAASAGQVDRAQELYEQLLAHNPEDEAIRQSLNQLRARKGLEPLEEMLPAPPIVVATLGEAQPATARPTASALEPPLDEDTERFISQAMTDVDLFSSYGLTQKAIDLLETVLQRAPRHTVSLEKLLDFHLGAGDDRRTAELAAQLEQIHLERGDIPNAERFSELRRRFQRAAGIPEEELIAAAQAVLLPEFSAPATEVEPPLVESTPVVEAAVAEAPDVEVPVAEADAVPMAETMAEPEAAVHEVDLSEEWTALSQQLEEALGMPEAAAGGPLPEAAYEQQADASAAVPATLSEAHVAEASADQSTEYEFELEPVESTTAQDVPAMSLENLLQELSADFDKLTPIQASADAAEAAKAPAAAPPGERIAGPLHEVFEEFRAELGELGADDEDLETHYNLGIAYREMGLLEEAIGEFQKVAKANDKGRAFRYAMQCCTLLGLAFMEKGQPEIAAMWYERALQSPGLDQESILALRYDLGVAQELAGDDATALKSFSEVYAANIDYRDVAERIAALRKHR